MAERPDALILSHQRSGTHFLQATLASHPQIHGRGEFILHLRRSGLEPKPNVFTNRAGVLNLAIVMYGQVPVFEEMFGSLMAIKIIHLLRDPRAVACSIARMRLEKEILKERYQAHYQLSEEPPKIVVSGVENLADQLEAKVRNRQLQFCSLLEGHPQILRLTYEELCDGNEVRQLSEHNSKRLLEFLGLEYAPLHNTLRKTGIPYPAKRGRP